MLPQNSKHTVFLAFLLLFSFLTVLAGDDPWLPVSSEELAMKSPKIEADADAEAIFWEVRIDDSSSDNLTLKHYVRVKVFTERGRDKYSKFDIPYTKGIKIKDLAARVVLPDNTITELKKEDYFDREIFKTDGVKIKAKSFAVPNVGPGVIVEYRYKEVISDAGAKGMRLQFQRDIPIQNLSYYYKPYNKREPEFQTFNFTDTKFIKDKDGYFLASRKNVPAFREEPRMPPEDTVKPWMLLQGASINLLNVSAFSLSFTIKDPSNPKLYWGGVSTEYGGLVKNMTKPNKEITKLAQEITAGATTNDEKLAKLFEYCQTQIKNTDFDTSLTDEQRRKLPKIDSLTDVIKRKSASSMHIDLLFGAMASSLGMDARVALSGNRNKMFFTPEMTNDSFIHFMGIAIKDGNTFKYYNPCTPYQPIGTLPWFEEGVWTLNIGEKNYFWEQTPAMDVGKNIVKRIGRFKLLEDGTLEGNVRVEYGGQQNMNYKAEYYDETADKREQSIRDEIKAQISTAEVSELALENADLSQKPFSYSYKVRVPNYAQKTGKRLFFQPGFFKYGTNPQFSASTRKYDIYFRYPWSEEDDIEIQYPTNYALDNADSPGLTADPQKIGVLDINIGVDQQSGLLIYKRKFHFGKGGNILFPSASYQPLKSLFELFHKADSHSISIKQK